MPLPTDFNHNGPKKRNWLSFVLILSLALNMFGLVWFVTRGALDSNLPIAKTIQNLKGQKAQTDLSEVQLIDRITRELSDNGGKIVFKEYALRKPKLDRLITQLEDVQLRVQKEMGQQDIKSDLLADDLDLIALLMAERLKIMTDLVAVVLPKLSLEDRTKLIANTDK